MRPWQVFIVWLLLSISWSESSHGVKGDVADDFLNDKEMQVKQIADLATANDRNTCVLMASCQSECSRAGCAPLLNDKLTCTYVSANQNCNSSAGTPCNNIRVNFERSYVRTPTYFAPGAVPPEVVSSVCAQRKLDPLFLELQKLQNSSEYYFNFYFGSADGSFRFYPGVEVRNCYTFDPRKRPWYNGAISVLKDVVIIMDSGRSMGGNVPSVTFQTTRFAAAQNASQQLLTTLTANDRATVVTFNSSVEATPISASYSVPDVGLNSTDEIFKQLLKSINEAALSNSIESNFTAGLNQALLTFNTGQQKGALKIVILLTDGDSSPSLPLPASIMEEFQSQGIKLLIYEIAQSNSNLAELACQVGGLAERLNPLYLLENPLFALNSYFSFLARTQLTTLAGTKPFWQRIYPDYSSLGPVITVAYPAMSSNGSRLIGVVGIDIQVVGLPPNFRNQLDNNLVNLRKTKISISNGRAELSCNLVYNASFEQCNSGNEVSPFCKKTSNSKYKNLVCCANCGVSHSQKSIDMLIAAIVSSVVGLVLVGLSMYLWFRFRSSGFEPVDPIIKIKRYSYKSLAAATNQFSPMEKLGQGSSGTVFRGTLKDGTKVAVKKLFHRPNLRDFQAEIRVLVTANHINLVALKGFCQEQHQLLVFEYVENGDLNQWLFPKQKEPEQKVLQWKDRVCIAQGVAKGLAYLHEDLQNHQRVAHSDIKPANILLDANFNPKVADFGMAKLYKTGSEQSVSGYTPGYIAPEIQSGAPATTKADVYAFGMVLLVMVSGRNFSDPISKNLRMWADTKVQEGNEIEVIDHHLGTLEEADKKMAKRLIDIGLLCTCNESDSRPDMRTVERWIVEPDSDLPLRTVSPSLDSLADTITEASNTFSTQTSSWGVSKPRSARSQDSKPINFVGLFERLKFKAGRSNSQQFTDT